MFIFIVNPNVKVKTFKSKTSGSLRPNSSPKDSQLSQSTFYLKKIEIQYIIWKDKFTDIRILSFERKNRREEREKNGSKR